MVVRRQTAELVAPLRDAGYDRLPSNDPESVIVLGRYLLRHAHPIFQLDKILRPAAKYDGQAGGPTVVHSTCYMMFEEPVLHPVRESAATLENIMHVLPRDVLYFCNPGTCVVHFLLLCSLGRPNPDVEHLSSTHPNRTWEAISIPVTRFMGFATEDLACFLQVLFRLSTDDLFPNLHELHG